MCQAFAWTKTDVVQALLESRYPDPDTEKQREEQVKKEESKRQKEEKKAAKGSKKADKPEKSLPAQEEDKV